jgi:hypothetical protein
LVLNELRQEKAFSLNNSIGLYPDGVKDDDEEEFEEYSDGTHN